MAYEQKPNSGSMFVNERKESENHPDRKGTALIDGVEYWVSGWIKEGKEGKPIWLSMAFKRKEEQKAKADAPKPAAATPANEFEDDIPF